MDNIEAKLSKLNVEDLKHINKSKIKYNSGYTQIIRTNDDGRLEGDQELYDNNNVLVSFEQYRDGLKHGICRKFVGKNVVYEVQYRDGNLDGTSREWDVNGNMLSKIDYKNGLKDGKSIVYLKSHKQIRYTEYSMGKIHGNDIVVEGDVNTMEQTYHMGIPYGKRVSRHLNGKIRCISYFLDGEVEGPVIEYDEDGNIVSKMMCVKGRFVGAIQ